MESYGYSIMVSRNKDRYINRENRQPKFVTMQSYEYNIMVSRNKDRNINRETRQPK